MAPPALRRSAAVGRHCRAPTTARLMLAALAGLPAWPAAVSAAEVAGCESPIAWIIQMEGDVSVRRAAAPEWHPARAGEALCDRDEVQTRDFSRAIVRGYDKNLHSVNSNSHIGVRKNPDERHWLLKIFDGITHTISRDSRELEVGGTFFNAGLEGTELLVQVAAHEESAAIDVVEGVVVLSNPTGETRITNEERATVTAAAVSPAGVNPNSLALLRTASYYPPLLAGPLPDPRANPVDPANVDFLVARAAARLARGARAEAEEDLAAAEAIDSADARTAALRSQIALVGGDHAAALALAEAAVARDAQSGAAWLALSYALEAGDLQGAVDAASRARALEPAQGIAIARYAELLIASDKVRSARDAASEALQIEPDSAYVLTVNGFAELRSLEPTAAEVLFKRAIELDPRSPWPVFGLYQIAVRENRLEDARELADLAVILDPANEQLRSYISLLYDARGRSDVATTQLALAQRIAPGDSTAQRYIAALHQSAAQMVEALRNVRSAADLNDGVFVSRSSLGLDEDLVTREGGVGPIYTELGFLQLGREDSRRLIESRPSDPAGHQLLADIVSVDSTLETLRVDERFQATLLTPLNRLPAQPQLMYAASTYIPRRDRSDLAATDFAVPLATEGVQMRASAYGASRDTVVSDFAVAYQSGAFGVNFGQYRAATEGFRPNNDIDERVAALQLSLRPNAATTYTADLRATRTESGDLNMRFDRDTYGTLLRKNEATESLRMSMRRDLPTAADAARNRSTLLASVALQDYASEAEAGDLFDIEFDDRSYSLDLRHILEAEKTIVNSGVVYSNGNAKESTRLLVLPGMSVSSLIPLEPESAAAYVYAQRALGTRLTATVGISVDHMKYRGFESDDLSGKLGLAWRPTKRTTLRAAAFESAAGRSLSTSHTNLQPRLEPTQVAGFAQVGLGGQAGYTTAGAIGFDQTLAEGLFIGAEVSSRDVELPVFFATGNPDFVIHEIDQRTEDVYLYWTPGARSSLAVSYGQERYDRPPSLAAPFTQLDSRAGMLEFNMFNGRGFTGGFRATHVHQQGSFARPTLDPDPLYLFDEDRFWLLDLSLAYRLPQRHGALSLTVQNALDERFNYEEIELETLTYVPQRTVSFGFTLAVH